MDWIQKLMAVIGVLMGIALVGIVICAIIIVILNIRRGRHQS
ncbi:hypothetical protein PQ472_10715 [Lacticaseibacillus pabuli]|uniref:Uncharacterized protein n=1 Tax=Lacticaseibacillus pabuli TaxID=3025672 RepID=A0ABY7WQ86_9LACO|nr:hypothetical protein [Lacticaseibacillus sp. KACC 23028]WDF82348.1 hypothetical protein PQ472_10715 [Lacticaseibacillus sp. KACC 23028]